MPDKPGNHNSYDEQQAPGGDGGDHGDKSGGQLGLVLLPLDVVQLQELVLWCRLAIVYITSHRQEVRQVMQSMMLANLTIEITDANVTTTLERLSQFANVLQEGLNEMRINLAMVEAKIITSEGKLQ
jgi:hypothetical protein